MTDFINWCNDNQGFLTFILSAFTIIISIIAIFVSFQTARLPYRKRAILNSTHSYIISSNSNVRIPFQIELAFSNVGNCPVGLNTLTIGFKHNSIMVKLASLSDGSFQEQIVEPAGTVKFSYSYSTIIEYLSTEIKKSNGIINVNTKLYIYARDTEGKNYKRYLTKAGNVIKSLS